MSVMNIFFNLQDREPESKYSRSLEPSFSGLSFFVCCVMCMILQNLESQFPLTFFRRKAFFAKKG